MRNRCETWNALWKQEADKDYMKRLMTFLDHEYATEQIYPEKENIFSAFNVVPYQAVKVVILGQDPYHGKNQAHGMSFSVQKGNKIPPSLRNIYTELQNDVGIAPVSHGFLMEWAEQGVLLLNTVLTVRESRPNSHKGQGWETFTDEVIRTLNQRAKPIIFVLWGKHAEQKENLITNAQHVVLKSPHPSPFSARKGFFGSKPFSTINETLKSLEEKPIDWKLTP
ncbi:Uracil-DNA glycosylase [Bacillus sp. THAF10]|nr:Uracil-DNA glycosylase [Bacillus sp. THAF10]